MSYLQRVAEASAELVLSREELAYYSRHLLLPGVGYSGQRKLKAGRVLVAGAGGLGCPLLQGLAGAGVGRITVVDGDLVSASNLSRQWLHRTGDLGRNKAESAVEALVKINPRIEVVAVSAMLEAETADGLVEDHDVVVDATDNLEARYLIDEACARLDRPWVHGAVYRGSGRLAVFWSRFGASFRSLYPQPSDAPSCSEAGMLGALTGLVGSAQALRVVELLTGSADPKPGTVWTVSGNGTEWRGFRMPGAVSPEKIAAPGRAGLRSIGVDALEQALSVHEPLLLVDLREAETSPAPSAVPIVRASADAILAGAFQVPPSAKTILICAHGGVSGLLAEALHEREGRQVFSLAGGFAAWRKEGSGRWDRFE